MARVVVIIECGIKSGLGRVRRSLTLASALQDQGFSTDVVLSSPHGQALVKELDFTALLDIPEDISDALVVLDTCSNSADEINKICQAARYSLVIDDLAERPVTCDYLINPNLYADSLDYSSYSIGQAFLGPNFTLVDERFYAEAKPQSERRGTVVSFGGTDGGVLAVPIIEELLQKSSEPIWVPVPEYVEIDSTLEAIAQTERAIEIIRNADMPKLLGRSRAFIGAAGATTLEAIASGCHISVAATQKDQYINAAYLAGKGIPSTTEYHPKAMVQNSIGNGVEMSLQGLIELKAVSMIARQISSSISL